MRNWSILSPLCGAFLAKDGQLSVALLFDPDPSSPGLGRAKRCKLEQLEGQVLPNFGSAQSAIRDWESIRETLER
jgi:hypothetical protein